MPLHSCHEASTGAGFDPPVATGSLVAVSGAKGHGVCVLSVSSVTSRLVLWPPRSLCADVGCFAARPTTPGELNAYLVANNGYHCMDGDCNNLVLDIVNKITDNHIVFVAENLTVKPSVEEIQVMHHGHVWCV